jgi:hypothetical protein
VRADQASLDAVLAIRKENEDLVLFCEVNGKPIAKRHSGENWLSREPGWTVRGGEPGDYDTIEFEYSPRFEIEFGKVIYEPGAPKNAPRWVWRCTCGKCDGGSVGPFKTRREAEKDAETWCDNIITSEESVHH